MDDETKHLTMNNTDAIRLRTEDILISCKKVQRNVFTVEILKLCITY